MNSKTKQTQKMSGDKKVKISVAENKDEDESSKTRRDSSKGRLELLETKYRSLVCEKRLMLVMFLVTLLATLLFVISFSTPYWLWIALSKPQTRSLCFMLSVLVMFICFCSKMMFAKGFYILHKITSFICYISFRFIQMVI